MELSKPYINNLGRKDQMLRLLWSVIWAVFARPFPRSIGNRWRLILLRLFGAKIAPTAQVYPSVNIYAPWNLQMDEYACLADRVICYNVAKVTIGKYATVSQNASLCTASHDIQDMSHQLITAPIVIEEQAWVASEAFIGMGVTIGEGAVAGARAAVFKNVPPWIVVGGNPAKFLKNREFQKL